LEAAGNTAGEPLPDRIAPLTDWVRDIYRGVAYACAVVVVLFAVTIPLDSVGVPVLGAVPVFDAFMFTLSALVGLLMPYAALG
jgi:hypothetical protein